MITSMLVKQNAYTIIGLLFIHVSLHLKPPSYIKTCALNHPNMTKCATENARFAVPHFINGDRKYNIPKLNPLILPEMKVESIGNTDAVGFGFVAKNAKIHGIEDVIIEKVRFDFENQNAEYHLTFPRLEILSNYTVHGQILLLPISGSGFGNITATDMKIVYKYNYTLEPRNDGKHYWVPTDSQIDYDIRGKMFFDLQNLFNGNEVLGKNMNEVLNENWKDVARDLGPIVAEAFSEITGEILKGVFSLVSHEDAFPVED